MKKLVAIVLALVLVLTCFTACQPKKNEGDLPILRVAVMPFYNGATVGYIVDNKLDEEAGFKIEVIMFPSGGPINEALPTDSYDIAATGGAYIFGIANYDAKIIGPYDDSTGGNEVWIQSNLPAAKIKGANADFPEIYGDKNSVKGLKILQNTGTTAQYAVVKWLEALGASSSDVEIVHMDFAQCYQAFKSKQADVAALVSPYCFQTDSSMSKVADLNSLGLGMNSEIMMPARSYAKPEMIELAKKFMKVMYSVGDAFEADQQKHIDAVYKWYKDNGANVSMADVEAECNLKSFLSTNDVKNMDFGKYEVTYAEFMSSQDKLTAEGLENVKKNIITDLLKDVIG